MAMFRSYLNFFAPVASLLVHCSRPSENYGNMCHTYHVKEDQSATEHWEQALMIVLLVSMPLRGTWLTI